MDPINLQYCIICDRYSEKGATHKVCMTRFTPDKFLSVFAYNSTAKKIILRSKFGSKSFKLLDILIRSNANMETLKQLPEIDVVVPIPMVDKIFNRRLINHSEYISNKVGDILKKPSVEILGKRCFSKSQKRLKKDLRFQNIKGWIFLKNQQTEIKGKRVLLVDDVATTGATLLEASRVLKMNGAEKVYCYTLAKDLRYN
ncbi:hypothetical protein A2982_00390 [candidate division WWE3 bacterium RIFCSPLOWO2_01_FULL_39_13]|uniref:Phosphoribosyltransferase domain-containing protein n=1 Tax=candidate division WWE3 bacterium RIFCSPLOWO2_01_FULL_39_13 TaxID=1802624 RepID=A0A1F4V558_UNCKA|nr:MAG: hypothetical protein A2982_00390 [candidate division WWE3 bacterium RIFCSPLOWO2_01_FULL_39_13]